MDVLASDHPLDHALGSIAVERQKSYRALFRTALDAEFIDALRAATKGGWALGGERFNRRIAKALGPRVVPLPKEWPAKKRGDKRQINRL